jgi:hypothetical protein
VFEDTDENVEEDYIKGYIDEGKSRKSIPRASIRMTSLSKTSFTFQLFI